MATNTNQKLAVLIDADNAQASVIQRAYGDWTTLSALGSQINRSHLSLDPRNYGASKLGDAVPTHLHVRRKATSKG